MKKIIFIFSSVIVIGLLSFVFLRAPLSSKLDGNRISVVTTLFPLYDFARIVGKDKVNVTLILPPGVEAHSFEPKPSDVVRINESNIFVYTGKFMEPWVNDVVNGVTGGTRIVDGSVGTLLMEEHGDDAVHHDEHDEHDEHGEHEDVHHHEGVDPHIWLGFNNAQVMVNNIAKSLIEVDPTNADYYSKNASEYIAQLADLDNLYKDTLGKCELRKIVYGGHYTFGYLANRYNLEYVSAQGFSPDSEPTAKDLISLVEQIKSGNIKYVFHEELTSPKIADTLSKETGAKLLLLNGAHNITKEDMDNNVSFVTIMKSNLKSLETGLNCTK
jgi:zinc transport system substrate-binding protein